MPYHLVTYDIRTPKNKDEYEKLYKTIGQFTDAVHVQDSVWIVQSRSSRDVYNALNVHMRSDDRLLVSELTDKLCQKNSLCGDNWFNGKFSCPLPTFGSIAGMGRTR